MYHYSGLQVNTYRTITAWYWQRNSYLLQWAITVDPDIVSPTYSLLIFDKEAKNTNGRKVIIFNKWWWQNWISSRMKCVPFLSTCTKPYSKCITKFSVRPKVLNHLEELCLYIALGFRLRLRLSELGTQKLRPTINKRRFPKLKSSVFQKTLIMTKEAT